MDKQPLCSTKRLLLNEEDEAEREKQREKKAKEDGNHTNKTRKQGVMATASWSGNDELEQQRRVRAARRTWLRELELREGPASGER